MEKNCNRVMIAAASSGSGKTMITCGILQALVLRGLFVASFKCGPDYIDPMFHSRVIGTASKNLDSFFIEEEMLSYLFADTAKDQDISVIEGVMGYYDGLGGIATKASSYDVAKQIKTPVILLCDCKGSSLSILATIKGFLEYKRDSRIQAVILNRMSPMLYPAIKKKIEEELSLLVLGYVPVQKEFVLESRHLGLKTPNEIEDLQEQLKKFAIRLEETLDLDGLLALAKKAEPCPIQEPKALLAARMRSQDKEKVRLAIARDEAFCFFYPDNLSLLEKLSAELVFFSPLQDKTLPEHIDGLWLCGGYPELYAKELECNKTMRTSIREALNEGLPCIAECGGFLYLHQSLQAASKEKCEMVGFLEAHAYQTDHLSRFGYVQLQALEDTLFGQKGISLPAHEFHYWESTDTGAAFLAEKPISGRTYSCIHGTKNFLAGFPHFYLYGNISAAEAFLETCRHRPKHG